MGEIPFIDDTTRADCLDLALRLADKHDDFPLQVTWVLPYGAGLPSTGHTFASPEQLRRKLLARSRPAGSTVPLDAIDALIAHEQEHAAAAVAVGFRTIRYFLRVRASVQGRRLQIGVLYGHPDGSITKLGFAAVQTAPIAPSQADLHLINVMGYADPDDVAERIIVHNSRPNVRPLPVPASYWAA